MAVHLLGIRHHGPGSARNVVSFLKKTKPDMILVEGPPEAEPLLQSVIEKEMKPPVALLAYNPENPRQAVFYPFAEFSAEWQAIYYGTEHNVPVRFFDMPLVHSFAIDKPKEAEKQPDPAEKQSNSELSQSAFPERSRSAFPERSRRVNDDVIETTEEETEVAPEHRDPFSYLAEAEGYSDGELWWELHFESRIDNEDIFEAAKEAVAALRESFPGKGSRREKLREAFMRRGIRVAQKEGYNNIVVVCGAWHVPALENMPSQKEDNDLIKGLPKTKAEVTWIPWTYNRLTYRSGYGAGVHSPGWYGHLWRYPKDDGTRWMSKIAKLLRKKNMDTSVAHVIEAVRLANALAALRNRSRAGLEELNEATVTVLGFGDEMLLKLIHEELIVSDKLGSVPGTVPKVPLLIDVERLQKKYRLQPTSEIKDLKLDLREPNDLAKSIFLHRILLLGVEWGHLSDSRSKGTFKEEWQLMWDPEHIIDIIEKGIWGNTLEEAATNYLSHLSAEVDTASQLVDLLEKSVPTDLPGAVEAMVQKLDTLAAATSDISELMKSVPGLANVVRYGNVRNTDLTALKSMLDSIVVRICIGLHLTCINIDIDAAQEILEMIVKTDMSISLVNDSEMVKQWQEALLKIHGSHQSNPLIAGYITRLLNDKRVLEYPEVEKQLSYYLSVTNAPADAAYWFEGFLRSSGTILLLDDNLWNLMNNWITSIVEENFTELLPVLRRTFAEFTQAERRKIGEKAKGMTGGLHKVVTTQENFDYERAEKIVGVVGMLLGLKP